ncbi:MAG: glycosyltransferase [Planctomycetota bacterium]
MAEAGGVTDFKLALFADPFEEGWPSMDLCAEMLAANLPPPWEANVVRPAGWRCFERVPGMSGSGRASLADRLLTRFVAAPRVAKRLQVRYRAFHVVDHTYAHVVHKLPAERTGVYCHDLDAFRSIVEPKRDPKPAWFRRLARWQLEGMRRARVVFHNSLATRDEILSHGLIDEQRLVHVPLGVAPEFTPEHPPEGEQAGARWQARLAGDRYLLHIGSCIPRKRIDVLLEAAAGAFAEFGDVRLLKIGAEWTPAQESQIDALGIGSRIVHAGQVERHELAAAYRGATAVLVTSEAEGYGLPVIEALACGAPVIASDLPVLREVGGDACRYVPVGEAPRWVEAICQALDDGQSLPPTAVRLEVAAGHSWERHAKTIARTYEERIG